MTSEARRHGMSGTKITEIRPALPSPKSIELKGQFALVMATLARAELACLGRVAAVLGAVAIGRPPAHLLYVSRRL